MKFTFNLLLSIKRSLYNLIDKIIKEKLLIFTPLLLKKERAIKKVSFIIKL